MTPAERTDHKLEVAAWSLVAIAVVYFGWQVLPLLFQDALGLIGGGR